MLAVDDRGQTAVDAIKVRLDCINASRLVAV